MKKLIIPIIVLGFLFMVVVVAVVLNENNKTSASGLITEISKSDSLNRINARMQFENGFYEGVIYAQEQYLKLLQTGDPKQFPVTNEMIIEYLKRKRGGK